MISVGRIPIRFVEGGWPPAVERLTRRFVRVDARPALAGRADANSFRRTMSLIQVGETIKITGSDRHPELDDLLLDHVDVTGATIVDMGASDGSTSLDLIRRLPDFGAYVISDRYLSSPVLVERRRTLLYNEDGECILVAGPRFVAWPHQSRVVAAVYAPLLRRAARRRDERGEAVFVNPDVVELQNRDPRVTVRKHDVFQRWEGPAPDVVKVANVLRRLYFSDNQIARGLTAIHDSLPIGGHLLLVDNTRDPGASMHGRGALYRRTDAGFERVASSEPPPEIDDLIVALAPVGGTRR